MQLLYFPQNAFSVLVPMDWTAKNSVILLCVAASAELFVPLCCPQCEQRAVGLAFSLAALSSGALA